MEKVDILIVVLAGNTKLSNKNLKAQKLTWMQNIEKDVKVLTLSGGDKFSYDGTHLTVLSSDDYSSISFKTLKCFEWLSENIEFNYLFRTNTSSYVDIKNLKQYCQTNKNEYLYRGKKVSNYFDDAFISYVSGAEILISNNVFKLLTENKDDWDTNLMDDVSIGKILQNQKIPIEESKSIIFDNSFFKLNSFRHEYHFRCRVDSPYYFPRFLDSSLLKYIHKELNKEHIAFLKRLFYFLYFNICRIFAFQKHYDFFTYHFFRFAKKILNR